MLSELEEKKLSELYAPFAARIRNFIIKARQESLNVSIFEGYRSFERQKDLYQKGRDLTGKIIDQRKIVTNAPPGFSFHNYGLACDIVFDGSDSKPGFQWSWSDTHEWKKLAQLGKDEFGLEPAYFWKSFPEAPHYQCSYGLQVHELLLLYNSGGLKAVWDRLDSYDVPLPP